jgi:predicted AlkP superfamily pyrophosphatase or phosphodiesterase
MDKGTNKLLIVNVAALGRNVVSRHPIDGMEFRFMEPVFPAVTCTVQASFRTGLLPRDHGMVANGLFFRDLRKPMFWEQASSLVSGERIWEKARRAGRRVGMMFWQQSLGEQVDLVLSPKPVHKHGGGMIQDCYSQPHDLYAALCAEIGSRFNLMHYWGPMASRKSSDWIVAALRAVLRRPEAPDLLLGYLPHLDYDLQRYGPKGDRARQAMAVLGEQLSALRTAAEAAGYDWLFFGDYAVRNVSGEAVLPNQALRRAGLMQVRKVGRKTYPDFFGSRAVAVVDHQVAHVYCADQGAVQQVHEVLERVEGVDQVAGGEALAEWGVDHPRAGELLLVAEEGRWFGYPWWEERREAPDYATHVDIHNKPGYDPCELFLGWPPPSVSLDTRRIHGSHGRPGRGTEAAWTSSIQWDEKPGTLLDLSHRVRDWISGPG